MFCLLRVLDGGRGSTSEAASDEFADSWSRRSDVTLTIREPRRPYELTCFVLVPSISWMVSVKESSGIILCCRGVYFAMRGRGVSFRCLRVVQQTRHDGSRVSMALPQPLRVSITPPELELIASEHSVEIVPLIAMEKTAFISVERTPPSS